MPVLPSKDTDTVVQFKASLRHRVAQISPKKAEAARHWGIDPKTLIALLKEDGAISIGMMEKTAKDIGTSLLDMLIEGQALLADQTTEDEKLN